MIGTFYIYVDGSDLDEVAPQLRSRIETFIAPYGDRVRVVDQREEEDPRPGDLPSWDLGVNFAVDALTEAEKKDLLLFFQSLSAEFGREFVLGGVLSHGQGDDFVVITAGDDLDPAIRLLANEKKG